MDNLREQKVGKDPYGMAKIVQFLLQKNNKLDSPKKYIWISCLDKDGRLLDLELLYEHEKEEFIISNKEVFTIPIHTGAAGIIFIQNHLDGSIEPTVWDQATNKKIHSGAIVMDIPLLDHLLINETDYYSFKEAGLLEP